MSITVECHNFSGNTVFEYASLFKELRTRDIWLLWPEETYQAFPEFFELYGSAGHAAPNASRLVHWYIGWPDNHKNVAHPLVITPTAKVNELASDDCILVRPRTGRELPDADDLTDTFYRLSQKGTVYNGQTVLISAGPTVEDIDPVRFFSNRSSGKMGRALARMAYRLGADVHLVCGPVNIDLPSTVAVHMVRSAADMHRVIHDIFPKCDYFFSAAAVADFTPDKQHTHKIKKSGAQLSLTLVRTRDILQDIARQKKAGQKIIGFSVETEKLLEHSREKMERKKLDMIVANNPMEKGAGFAVDTNKVTLITKDKTDRLPLMSKTDAAAAILHKALTL
ncbi:MAG: phosphopantothenoylcysteine decarboxylase [Calditrichaeota bacterium]|nr:MAG: phosphopantothenoylcysteine decarboxylase [Calditrichota bacterium]